MSGTPCGASARRIDAPAVERLRTPAVDQVGALPYRVADGRTEVLLVTSRDSGRWILPKGNPIVGLAAHEAAAQEAFEEAGVRGFACPSPLGSYHYLKRRRRGNELLGVSLYCLAVIEQFDTWPERHQRTRRWFAPAQAARLVAEAELRALIAGFHPASVPRGLGRMVPSVVRDRIGRRLPMLGWLQSLVPGQGRFFDQFEAHAATLVAGADALARLFHAEGSLPEQIATVADREHDADAITREVLQDVRRVSGTPFDRSAMVDLIGAMDDAIDQMNKTASSVALYGVTEFAPQMRDISAIVVEAARVTAEAIPLLRSLAANAQRLHGLTARLIEIDRDADDFHDAGLKALFKASGDNPTAFLIGRAIYSHLERIVDRFEDVANVIERLAIDHG